MIKKYIRLTYFNDSDNKEARDKMLKKVHGEDKFLSKQAINTGTFVNKVANKGSNYVNDKTNKMNNFVGDKMKSVTQIFEPKPTAGISDYIEKQINEQPKEPVNEQPKEPVNEQPKKPEDNTT